MKVRFNKEYLKKNKLKIAKFFLVLTFIVIWSFFLIVIGPSDLINLLGETNSLLILFIIGTFGGVSTLTATFFYSTLLSLAHGGIDPLSLGLVGGVAITIGDSLFYYLGRSGREALYGTPKKWSLHLSEKLKTVPSWLIPVVTFVYAGLTPLPNDILTVSLGLAGIRYMSIILAMLIANIFLTTLVAFVASSGFF